MTCVVGYLDRDAKQAWLGADSGIANDTQRYTLAHPKVFVKQGILFGVSGSWRLSQIIQYRLALEDTKHPVHCLTKWAAQTLVPRIQKCCIGNGYSFDDKDDPLNAQILMATRTQLVLIDTDLSVQEYTIPYVAIGAGEEYAMGSLYATMKCGAMDHREQVLCALEAANKFAPSVTMPFNIITIGGPAP